MVIKQSFQCFSSTRTTWIFVFLQNRRKYFLRRTVIIANHNYRAQGKIDQFLLIAENWLSTRFSAAKISKWKKQIRFAGRNSWRPICLQWKYLAVNLIPFTSTCQLLLYREENIDRAGNMASGSHYFQLFWRCWERARWFQCLGTNIDE